MINPITITESTDIDLVSKYNTLTEITLNEDSPYIRAKETLLDILNDNSIDAVAKDKLIATTISNLTGQITQSCLATALEWGVREKDLTLQQLKLEYELGLLNQQMQTEEVATKTATANLNLIKARIIKEYGIPTYLNGELTGLDASGKVSAETNLINQQTANALTTNTQITAQTEELYARTHETVANTYVNHGNYNGYTVTPSGIININKLSTHTTLSDMNLLVAREQAKGYTLNAWTNATSASASMLGTLVATEATVDYASYFTKWVTGVDKLNALIISPDIENVSL